MDFHVFGEGFGRLRRLYVLKEYRRSGAGRSLTETIISGAKSHFRAIVLKTDNPEADKFYISLGFTACIDAEHSTHRLDFH
jgi:GNAT superfamily N-acetyltransferase